MEYKIAYMQSRVLMTQVYVPELILYVYGQSFCLQLDI